MSRCRMSFETLVDFQEGRASADAQAQVRAHLAAGCAACEQTLTQLGRLLTAFVELDRHHAPAETLEQAQALYRERFRKPERRSIIATLVSGFGANPAFAGARGQEAEERRMVFDAEEYDLDLWQEPDANGDWYLIGQVYSKAQGAAILPETVTLAQSETAVRQARMESGEYHLEAVAAGRYTLRATLPDCEIVVPELAVGA